MNKEYLSKDTTNPSINIVIRIFHWSIVVLFVVLFTTGENNNGSDDLHIVSGYLMASLILSRIVWGFIGDKNALWGNYLHQPKLVFIYLYKLFSTSTPKFKLHNPAGGSMILLKMIILFILVATGLLIEALFEFDGALFFVSYYLNESQAIFIKEVHSMLAHLMLLIIAAHLLGVIYSSHKYRINMLLMMITGKIR